MLKISRKILRIVKISYRRENGCGNRFDHVSRNPDHSFCNRYKISEDTGAGFGGNECRSVSWSMPMPQGGHYIDRGRHCNRRSVPACKQSNGGRRGIRRQFGDPESGNIYGAVESFGNIGRSFLSAGVMCGHCFSKKKDVPETFAAVLPLFDCGIYILDDRGIKYIEIVTGNL